MARTKRDFTQITQYEHDELTNAKRVKLTDTEISMELDADDGDSVQVQGRLLESSTTELDISIAREIKIYAKSLSTGQKPTLSVKISPKADGNDFMEIATMVPSSSAGVLVASQTIPVLAKRVKIDGIDETIEVTILGRG